MGKESCACIERSKVIVIRTIVKKTWYERNKNMTLLTYQVFKTVADHGSFRKAADILGLTPSAISHAISSMENELGFSVLNRSKAGVTLTNYGENLLPYVNAVLNSDESLWQAIAEFNGLKKGKVKKEEIDLYFGGDLNNQITACYYYANHLHRPFIGLYSACSTIGLALANASIMIENHNIHSAMACTVSHNATAERQFRYPLEYGIQRKETMTFTATGSVAVFLSNKPSQIRIESITLGKVIDFDQYDANDMGRAMAPAALDTYLQHMKDLKRDGTYYDLILTGDLSRYGKTIMKDLLKEENQKYNEYDDCGCLLYDVTQNVYQGGSGPVCNGLVSFGYIYQMMLKGKYQRVLVLATGALLNPVMTNQKLSIPCVCHGYVLEVVK